MTKTSVAREYIRKFPKKSDTGLARIVFNENKPLFNSPEDARDAIRYSKMKRGSAKNRKSAVNIAPDLIETERKIYDPHNPLGLPASDEEKYEPFLIKGHKRVAVFSDIHVPYHNITALTTAIQFAKKEKPDALLLNGDCLDAHGLSKYLRDPRKKDFKGELDTFKALIVVLKKQLNCQIYFKIGNHDERYELYLQQKAGELQGVDEFQFENIIKARAEGIRIIGSMQIAKMNALNIIHGHEYKGGISAPVNIARGLYLRGKVSAAQGHNHTTSEHTEPNMNGEITTTWSSGCLCELHPRYMPLNKWNHGFMMVDLDDNKRDYEMRNLRIYNGKVL
jgi:predicted phosphodiesterase